MPKTELDVLPVIDADESEQITVAVSADDMQAGDEKNPERHPVAIALRRKLGVDDARVSKREVLIRRGHHWYRYNAPNSWRAGGTPTGFDVAACPGYTLYGNRRY